MLTTPAESAKEIYTKIGTAPSRFKVWFPPFLQLCHRIDVTQASQQSASSNHINKKKWFHGRFAWQEGYGAFLYGHSQLNMIIRYIQNQEKQHSRRSFRNE
jgi:hypothetical protein